MIAVLLASLASAQGFNSVGECTNQYAYPIAGTVGYENSLAALRINAVTYSATAFAERSLFPRAPTDEEQGGVVVWEINQAYGVGRVPTLQVSDGCPEKYQLASRPLDLTSANLGVALRYKRVSAYYSAGVVYGNAGEPNNITRAPLGVVVPTIASSALLLASVTGSRQVIQGTTMWAIDSIAGAEIDAEVARLRAGYALSRGLHLSFTQDQVGLFGNTVLRNTLKEVGQYEAGIRRLGYGEKAAMVGRTSLYGRGIPVTEAIDALRGEGPEELVTGHFEQTDIGRKLDVVVALAAAPTPGLFEARVGWHSPGFHELMAAGDETAGRFNVQAGVVQLPTRWYYGEPGGYYVQARVESTSPVEIGSVKGAFNLALTFNDAQLLALYPFATNAFAYRYTFQGRF